MKKFFKLVSVLCVASLLLASVLGAFTVSAAIPTKLTFNQISSAPAIDAEIDSVYGEPVFDFSAKDTPVGEWNVFPRSKERMDAVMDAYNAMRVKGYVVFDKEYLYMAYDVTDVAPKVADNSTKFYKSTNLQLVFFVNDNLGYITAAYAGTNSVRVFNDDGNRSTMIIDNIDCKLTEKSKTNYIYEMRIPWVNFHEVETLDDVTDFKFALTQTSMGSAGTYKNDNGEQEPYVCSAFGKAYDLNYDSCVPVTLKKVAEKPEESKVESTDESSKDSAASSEGATGTGIDFGGASSTESSDTSSNKDTSSNVSNSESDKNKDNSDTSSNKDTSSAVSGSQTDKNEGNSSEGTVSKENAESSENPSVSDESSTITSDAESVLEDTDASSGSEEGGNKTLIMILIVVGALVIVGGAVAIILINKGAKD